MAKNFYGATLDAHRDGAHTALQHNELNSIGATYADETWIGMHRGQTAARLIADARRIVFKVGSSLIIDATKGHAREAWLGGFAEDVAELRGRGKEIVVVSSGAVALGRLKLGFGRSARLDHKQAAAAAGQTMLMQAWDKAFAPHGIPTAQLLLTLDDTERRRRWLNARATLSVLLAQQAVPVINENDSVATDELRYGDNDRLSARVAQMVQSDLLVLLSDVDGLYTADPARDSGAAHIPFVPRSRTRSKPVRQGHRRRASGRAECGRRWRRRGLQAAQAARRSSHRAAKSIRCARC
jgi:glutamate 5-kinase